MKRAKKARREADINVWPSSYPDDVGSNATEDSTPDSDELGSHFLSSGGTPRGRHAQWENEVEEGFDERAGAALLRSFGLEPMPKRTTTFPKPRNEQPLARPGTQFPPRADGTRARRSVFPEERSGSLPNLSAPRMPQEFGDYIVKSRNVDLTGETIREASLLDQEAAEPGEVEAPDNITDDVHTHGKRRGGHVRGSLRPPRRQRL